MIIMLYHTLCIPRFLVSPFSKLPIEILYPFYKYRIFLCSNVGMFSEWFIKLSSRGDLAIKLDVFILFEIVPMKLMSQ
jgi:hypothetical protein